MKKSLKIMAALLLISSVVGSTPLVNSVVHAKESSGYSDDNDALLRAGLLAQVDIAKERLAAPDLHDLYTPESIKSLSDLLAHAQNVLDNYIVNSYQTCTIDLMNATLTPITNDTESTSTESTSTESTSTESTSTESTSTESTSTESTSTESTSTESTSTESTSTESTSTESTSTESTSTESTSTESTSTESTSTESTSTESTSTESTSTESTSTESTSTESGSSEEATPSIEVKDQTVYVGQTLTEDIVLSWATFKNADGLTVGFEVVGEPIQVTALGNTLVEPGTHKIRFYVSKPAQQRSSETVVAEKVITLNVLPESDNPLKPTSPKEETKGKETKAPNKDLISQVASPISNTAKKTIDSAKTTAKQLPSTGETNNGMMIASAGVLLISGAYIFRKKQLDK
ncbi:hypothetical protein BCR21_05370 [Enterococcus ureasiticus]|uniref:Gram-positive cocci surface proteins LPxTG domain-containing protein n=1 Tax=Enterococcus ureasiticus TaxID=903984 RepID=A0A1E5GQA6_9ENTE|nr:LPXTG cell wall anchor domain-containing protein [Enterococcus ureasiticus]OEG14420.1 hypothetical protein BCR21_05370 [Enterococcus ureasiticus]